MWPNRENGSGDSGDENSTASDPKEGGNWEMHSIKSPAATAVPYTPRTQAFHTLDRRLLLRPQEPEA